MHAAPIVLLQRFARISLATLAAVLLLPVLAASAGEMVSVSGDKTNMRAGPGTSHEARWILSRGYPLMVIGREGNWLKVQDFENDVGWILKSLTSSVAYHIVTARVANLRAKPDERSRALGQAAYGEVVQTLEKRPSWVLVQRSNKVRGWIARRLLWGW
jgi:SH3-like domain-containing protein